MDSDPDIVGLEPAMVRRIRQTIACRDADTLPRVEGAGEIFEIDGRRVQRMFNGVLVEEGGYFGDFTTPIVSRLGGVHEPQEEVVVHAILERLKGEQESGLLPAPLAIELGCFWSYYSLWFCQDLPGARAVAIEPDPAYLEVGRRNAALNTAGDRITFVAGGISATTGGSFPFTAESDGVTRVTEAYDLGALLTMAGASRADVLYCDIQGYETPFLEHAAQMLVEGAVRFVVMSTHHRSISGNALTHQHALERLTALGGHVVAEHTVSESCSGDGLIVVSFDDRDRDFTVSVSHVRARDSLFGEPEYDVNHQLLTLQHEQARADREQANAEALAAEVERLRGRVLKLKRRNVRLRRRVSAAEAETQQLKQTATWRIGRAVTAPTRMAKRRVDATTQQQLPSD